MGTGVTAHYVKNDFPLLPKQPASLHVTQPKGAPLVATHAGTIPIDGVPKGVVKTHSSVGQCRNHGYKAIFEDEKATRRAPQGSTVR